jgi:uncharacterized protein YkwD
MNGRNNFSRSLRSLSLIFTAALVTACGGGGGSSTPAATTPAPVVATTVASTITAATVTPNYTGEELAAYNNFSTARTTCGFGGLNQNTSLDTATVNHNAYMAMNYQFGHYETLGLTDYTGNQPYQRGVAAGYTSAWTSYGEVLTEASGTPKSGFGALGSRRLLAAPYHMTDIFAGFRDVGISVKSSGQTGSGADYIVSNVAWSPYVYLGADFGAQPSSPAQHQSSSDVLTYPCEGVTGTVYQLTAETPNPVPSRNLATNPIGQPIFVQVLAGQTLVISSVTVTGPSGSVGLLPTMTSANDPNTELAANQAFIMPSAPLAPSSTYTVAITGTNNGATFSKNFTFTTGSIY